MKYPVFILLLAFLFGCVSKNKVEEQDTNKPLSQTQKDESIGTDLTTPEDFKTFYAKFLKDENFQLSRINFPLEGEIIEEDLEASPIQRADWSMIKGSVYEVDQNEYKVEIKESSTEVDHRIYIEDSGVDISLKYKQIEEKWFLVYYKSIFI
ncbi:MAG: hypothetical protein ACK5M3_16130 [Dysgonomonas sp.]